MIHWSQITSTSSHQAVHDTDCDSAHSVARRGFMRSSERPAQHLADRIHRWLCAGGVIITWSERIARSVKPWLARRPLDSQLGLRRRFLLAHIRPQAVGGSQNATSTPLSFSMDLGFALRPWRGRYTNFSATMLRNCWMFGNGSPGRANQVLSACGDAAAIAANIYPFR